MKLNLKAYLAIIGLTIKDFGEIIELNPIYLSQISNGKRLPSKKTARLIERATDGHVKIDLSQKPPRKRNEFKNALANK